MSEIVNLNKARKARAQAEAKATAAANRAKFGRTKGDKAAIKLEAAKTTRTLDGAKRED
ncbi:DUF4169 family protein [Phenylobacterium aquaticum]|uniref:DUF4169 family protein n=1 Tax=Phenylobacterium aquaticum TaxID=1763816 RepID=UPI001F5DC30F|nr:DUF4169 family protein [Phenylobacterium aquaticum]MCI3135611.1 DUF4169 family protein [Phenylobacterium aquaticum]